MRQASLNDLATKGLNRQGGFRRRGHSAGEQVTECPFKGGAICRHGARSVQLLCATAASANVAWPALAMGRGLDQPHRHGRAGAFAQAHLEGEQRHLAETFEHVAMGALRPRDGRRPQ